MPARRDLDRLALAGLVVLALALPIRAQAVFPRPSYPSAPPAADAPIGEVSPGPRPFLEFQPHPITGLPALPPGQGMQCAMLAGPSSAYLGVPRRMCPGPDCAEPLHPQTYQERCMAVHDALTEQACRMPSDFRNMYLSRNALWIGLAIGGGAVLANTQGDRGARDWYQDRVHGRQIDDVARRGAYLGDWWVVVPVVLGASIGGHLCPESPVASTIAEWGDRSGRALIVGAPTVGVLALVAGGNGPGSHDSRWNFPGHPPKGKDLLKFRTGDLFDRGYEAVSLRSYLGAVPFLTAASMSENRALKALFFAGSFVPTWADVHDDRHYLSQALIGWSIAFLATHSVNQTESEFRHVQVGPLALPQGPGMGVEFRY